HTHHPSFTLPSHAAHRDLHSFPTRRSSDLIHRPAGQGALPPIGRQRPLDSKCPALNQPHPSTVACGTSSWSARALAPRAWRPRRSEEHTSELQSRFDLVCRLLLEKKKQDIS